MLLPITAIPAGLSIKLAADDLILMFTASSVRCEIRRNGAPELTI
jgi:hypothetical protein